MKTSPSLFLSHGSPMLALENERTDGYVKTLRALGERLPRPKAVLNVSAHWYGPYKRADVSAMPRTIYDFYGFPEELYRETYSVKWYPEGVEILKERLPDVRYEKVERGVDHGMWTVFKHLFPKADVPVFSISIDSRDSPEAQMRLWEKLRILREEEILIVTNGNVVHNLRGFDPDLGKDRPYPFGSDFDSQFGDLLFQKEYSRLLRPHDLKGWLESCPTLEHYVPALITIGTSYQNETATTLFEGFEGGSIGRRAFWFGLRS